MSVHRSTHIAAALAAARGSSVTVHFWDEAGHLFDVSVRFHKGKTYIQRSPCRACDDPPPTLWRD